MAEASTTIRTNIPARLDRLAWSKFHRRVLIGLGTVWILDGLEVTMVGSVASRLTESGSGLGLQAGQIGIAAAVYIVGACVGALVFGQLTDRFGRKKLFLITLGLYIVATVATAFSFAPWYFYLARFFTGAGIGGEYSAINSAIDELIPARLRGRIDLIINGTYWLGAAVGSALVVFLLSSVFPSDIGWRFAFGIGAVLGLVILVVRRHVPESPRWLFIHGRDEEAERIVAGIEREVAEETGQELDDPEETIEIRQRQRIPFREIARTAFKRYPRRAVLGLALFVGQAFIYNGITFNLGTLLSGFFGTASGTVPIFLVIYAVGNLLGPLLLGRLFDTVGRKPMITIAYLGSAVLTLPLTWIFYRQWGGEAAFIVAVSLTFFLASSGASAAYLTVSEIFPMETRALAIAFFYAVGTGLGGIVGPLMFGSLIGSGHRGPVAIGFLVAAGVMALGGVAELIFGVKAENESLEDIAEPLSATDGASDS
ncbi:sugar transporter [Microlunatus endophyticus]|uniref:Sugar transporter n=1 Tax=Microlunatus endophyticus TaxID=1716077 RepID=A0A917S1B6_9ACTN|nr:MFS transporter [Microlunatus endophyticus]GGL48161.1 sugar transporter [Microlunatus endophyticus]